MRLFSYRKDPDEQKQRLADGFELVPDSSDPTFRPKVYDNGNPADEKVTIIGEVVYHVMPYDWEY